jgi:hypothetical protein
MTIPCTRLDDLLYDGSPLAMETAAEHAKSCASCAETLAAWNEMSATAQSLRVTWKSDLLWPRIEKSLRAGRRTSPMRRLWQYAAALLITAGLGWTMFYALRLQTREAAFDRRILRVSALDEVERAEREHVRAIDRLEDLTEAKLEGAETPLLISYKEKLMLLDDAIAECQTNIDRNRQNAHLRRQLLSMYTEKQQTLQDVLREDSDVSTP